MSENEKSIQSCETSIKMSSEILKKPCQAKLKLKILKETVVSSILKKKRKKCNNQPHCEERLNPLHIHASELDKMKTFRVCSRSVSSTCLSKFLEVRRAHSTLSEMRYNPMKKGLQDLNGTFLT